MTVKEINHLCKLIEHSEHSMEHLFNQGSIDDPGDFEAIHQCVETLEQARFAIKALLDTVQVI